jgi:hypothetical protein
MMEKRKIQAMWISGAVFVNKLQMEFYGMGLNKKTALLRAVFLNVMSKTF